jgi:hypothetical protein
VLAQNQDSLDQITVTAQKLNGGSFSLSSEDYYSALPGVYTSLSDVGLERLGIGSASRWGIKYGLPSLVSDIPGGLASVYGAVQTYQAYDNGDYLAATQAGGATLGGIGGAELGAFLRSFGGPIDFVTVPLGAVAFGLVGAYGGGNVLGSIYNNGFDGSIGGFSPPPPSPADITIFY